MKSDIIKLLLLLSLFFNIAHASIIISEEHCSHKSASQYVQELDHDTECGDLCDFHHLFHFTAIITPAVQYIAAEKYTERPEIKLLNYHPSFRKTENKPPIA